VVSTVPPNGAIGVDPNANITATFSEAVNPKSLQICNHCTFTSSSKTFYLLKGNFTAPSEPKNPPRSCTTIGTRCPDHIPARVSYDAGTNTATLNPTSTLEPGKEYTAVVEAPQTGTTWPSRIRAAPRWPPTTSSTSRPHSAPCPLLKPSLVSPTIG
jgi:Bacterial Ig-like domain